MTITFHEKVFDVSNKVIVLTGSAGRVGSHFSHTLASAGANLILIDKDKKILSIKKEIENKFEVKIFAIIGDITKKQDVKKITKLIQKEFGHVDVLINNAHYVPRTHPKRDLPLEEFPLELWELTIKSNLNGLFLMCQEIGKTMIKQKKGVIVNISSIYGVTGPDQRIYGKSRLNSPAFYSATKGAMVNLTKYLASSWKDYNIRVNTLTLGGVFDKKLHTDKKFVKNYSNKTMIGRMANVDDFDGALLFLTSDASKYMTGSNIIIDGGWTSW